MLQSIGYLGPAGSYSYNCLQLIKQELDLPNIQTQTCLTITDIFEALAAQKISLALIPLENSLGGSVTESLDRLLDLRAEYKVLAEWVLPVKHCLIGFKPEPQEIRAHYQSLAQCHYYLKHNHASSLLKEMNSNSAAVQSLLRDGHDKKVAAIASQEAAALYQIPILAHEINDSANNSTRFWLIGQPEHQSQLLKQFKQKPSLPRLVSLALQLPQDQPGSLAKLLELIAKLNINLCRIESRPTRHNLGEYVFFIDLLNKNGEVQNDLVQQLQKTCHYFGFLGNYPVFAEHDLRFL